MQGHTSSTFVYSVAIEIKFTYIHTSNVDYNLKLKKYYKRVSCIYSKVRLQMATSVYVSATSN